MVCRINNSYILKQGCLYGPYNWDTDFCELKKEFFTYYLGELAASKN